MTKGFKDGKRRILGGGRGGGVKRKVKIARLKRLFLKKSIFLVLATTSVL